MYILYIYMHGWGYIYNHQFCIPKCVTFYYLLYINSETTGHPSNALHHLNVVSLGCIIKTV